MRIEIKTSEEFLKLLRALLDECVDAAIHFRLHEKLRGAIPDYVDVFNQSAAFWRTVMRALEDATLIRLCRIYDQYEKSDPTLNLRNLLDTIEENRALFEKEQFRERLKGNPFVDSLAEDVKPPDPQVLAADRLRVVTDEPRVKKLVIWRNNLVAHRSAGNVIDNRVSAKHPLTWEEIQGLIDDALEIGNRYCLLFIAEGYSSEIIGKDDCLWVLDTGRLFHS